MSHCPPIQNYYLFIFVIYTNNSISITPHPRGRGKGSCIVIRKEERNLTLYSITLPHQNVSHYEHNQNRYAWLITISPILIIDRYSLKERFNSKHVGMCPLKWTTTNHKL